VGFSNLLWRHEEPGVVARLKSPRPELAHAHLFFLPADAALASLLLPKVPFLSPFRHLDCLTIFQRRALIDVVQDCR
jgi:hypothetical protein